MDDKPLTLAQRIKAVRLRLGESQKIFGNRFGVQRLAVSEWEKGKPAKKHLREVEQFLKEQEDAQGYSVSYQFPLPFDQTVNFECKVSPKSSDSVHFKVQITTKAG